MTYFSTRFYIGAFFLIAIFAITASYTIIANRMTSERTEDILKQDLPTSSVALELLSKTNAIRTDLFSYVNGQNGAQAQFYDNLEDLREMSIEYLVLVGQTSNFHLIDGISQNIERDAEIFIFARYRPIEFADQAKVVSQLRENYGAPLREIVEEIIATEIKETLASENLRKVLQKDIPRIVNYFGLLHKTDMMLESLLRYTSEQPEVEGSFYKYERLAFDHLNTIMRSETRQSEARDLLQIRKIMLRVSQTAEELFTNFNPNAHADATKRLYEMNEIYFNRLEDILTEMSNQALAKTSTNLADLNAFMSQTQRAQLFQLIVATIVVLLILYSVSRYVISPLRRSVKIIGKLAGGVLDVDIPVIGTHNEIGILYAALGRYRTELIRVEGLRKKQAELVEERHYSELKAAYDEVQKHAIQLEKQTEKLSEKNSELEQFIHLSSHDLREPLKNIFGLCKMLARSCETAIESGDSARIIQLSDKINAASSRLIRLIDDLRQLIKITQNTDKKTVVDIAQLVDSILSEQAEFIRSQQMIAKADVSGNLYGSRALIRLLIEQLLENAIVYGIKGNVIQISAQETDTDFELTIRNATNPVEFDMNDAFLPFFRGQKTERGNSGIGLTMCKRIVENHLEGRIHIDENDQNQWVVVMRTARVIEGELAEDETAQAASADTTQEDTP